MALELAPKCASIRGDRRCGSGYFQISLSNGNIGLLFDDMTVSKRRTLGDPLQKLFVSRLWC